MSDRSNASEPTHRPSLIWCVMCGGEAALAAFTDRMNAFVCLATDGRHAWLEPRNPSCARCGARLTQHIPIDADGRTTFHCPVAAHSGTFARS